MNAADVHLEFSITERYVYIDDRIQCERGTPYKKRNLWATDKGDQSNQIGCDRL